MELPDSLGLLGPDALPAYAVDLTGPEIAALARTGTAVAHCPVSDLKPGCGIAPVPRLLSAGVTVGLGTDGAVSSNSWTCWGRCGRRRPDAVGAEQAVRMATVEGARALGLGDRLGSLEVGKRADLVVLDLAAPHLRPAHDPWSTLAYAAHSSDVRDTVVDGRVLMRDRVLTTLDERAAIADLEALVASHPGRSADVPA
ncbi:amidohydrolase family protein [Streptomyces antibioticus]|uniref:amidohydrolase family protein n=1 Tax=Streptomyces antibioticus TaxID=1890 RepID=UPI0033B104D8